MTIDIINTVICGDCLEVLKGFEDNCVDLVLTDPPYGITRCDWDIVPSLPRLWERVKAIGVADCVYIFTSCQPFTTDLINSNRQNFRYEWVWEKSKASNFLLAQKQPLKTHENILVFCCGQMAYFPQKTRGKPFRGEGRSLKGSQTDLVNKVPNPTRRKDNMGDRFPRSVIYFVTAESEGCYNPTQKPVELMVYLVKTYSNPTNLILDPFCGSGTTCVAAKMLGRRYIGIDISPEYCEIARMRLKAVDTGVPVAEQRQGQKSLFEREGQ